MPAIRNDHRSIINRIIRGFNFKEVHRYMTKVKWQWADGEGPNSVPTIDQLKDTARGLLSDILNSANEIISTGGFEVIQSESGKYIELRFIPWSTEIYIDEKN